jgi:hypothetical protein
MLYCDGCQQINVVQLLSTQLERRIEKNGVSGGTDMPYNNCNILFVKSAWRPIGAIGG